MNTLRKTMGFSLVEMAMVLVIIALLLGGLLPVISGQIELQRNTETRKKLAEIREALLGFAVANNRLPCPAQATLATGAADAGQEARISTNCACQTSSGSGKKIADAGGSRVACGDTSVAGVIPWATLGVSETDAWGRRFSYQVTEDFADGTAGTSEAAAAACQKSTGVSFQMCSEANLRVLIAASSATILVDFVPAIVVSHGVNGSGGYTSSGLKLANSTNADEIENADITNSLVSHDPSPTFDDLLTWVPPNLLLSRMISAGKLP
ncbi:MAG: type II secretion system protein [Sideroxydans sp.]|nr:type II secretion system protein [Sideroxydans sp.]